MAEFLQGLKPAVLASWTPKCTAEKEKRLNIKFETPLTEESLKGCPKNIQKASANIAKAENGVGESGITTEYPGLMLEIYSTPDSSAPILSLPNVTVRKIVVYRPQSSDGPVQETFLLYSIHTGAADSEMVSLVMDLWKDTCFVRFHEMQPNMFDGKAAAANDN